MLMLRELVCNYFERKGSFEGIEHTCVGGALSEISEKNGTVIEETCFQILGYRSKEEFDSKVAVISGDKSVLDKLGVSSFKEAADKLGIGKLRKVKRPVSKVKVNGIAGLDLLVAEFYKKDLTNVVAADDGWALLPFWLLAHASTPVETVLANDSVRKCFVKSAVAKCKRPVILNKVLYTDFEISGEDLETLNCEAIRIAMHKGEGNAAFYKMPADKLIFVSDTNPDVFLNLLEYSAASGCTYAGLLRTKFIEVPDFFKLYENLQCIFYKFGSQIAYKKDGSWVFEDVYRFLSGLGDMPREPLDIGRFVSGRLGAGRGVDAIHCF